MPRLENILPPTKTMNNQQQMRITEEQYDKASQQKEDAEKIINAYFAQKQEDFEARWERFKKGEPFKPDEIRYAARSRCACGAGMAYPVGCGMRHHWDCADVLLQKVKTNVGHDSFPFAFYEIKEEGQPSANGVTTRPLIVKELGDSIENRVTPNQPEEQS